ncbi:hypothetical protein ACFXKY_11385 [Streptomyces canus]
MSVPHRPPRQRRALDEQQGRAPLPQRRVDRLEHRAVDEFR